MYAPHTAGLQRHKSPAALSPPHVNMFNSYSYLTGTNALSQQASGDSLDVVGVSDATAARLSVNEQNTRTVIQREGRRQRHISSLNAASAYKKKAKIYDLWPSRVDSAVGWPHCQVWRGSLDDGRCPLA